MKGKRKQQRLRGGSDARQMIAALRAAGIRGADITATSQGHLQIACPGGLVTIPSDLSNPRTYANNRQTLAAHGVIIPARGAGGRGPARQRNQLARRRGTVTRYRTGETYGLAEDAAGDTWFISRSGLHPVVAAGMAYGREITFTGNPVPEPGRYPDACEVRLVFRDGEREQVNSGGLPGLRG